jgi:hypothetical protein
MDIYTDVASKIERNHRFQIMGRVTEVMSSIRSLFQEESYGLVGKIPKDLIENLEWVRNQGEIDDDTFNKLKLRVYEQACPEIYWKASQEILEKMKPAQSRKSSPVDLRNIDKRDYRIRLLKELKKLVPPQSLSIPIGKDWVRSRVKWDDLSKKNYPIVRRGMAFLYDLLLPFYPKPQLRTFGKRKGTGSQRYSTQLARDIVTLFKTELVFKRESDSLSKPLNDLEERDVFSAIQWVDKNRNKK